MSAPSNLSMEYYPARVTANEDPDKRGRVRVVCVGLLGDDETDLPMWVEPALDWGWFYVPDVGEIIEIACVTGSAQDESRNQMSLDNLDLRWHGARFYNTDADVPTPVNPAFTDTHYGKRRGFATPFGHYFMFDDTEDDATVVLTWVSKKDAGAEEISQMTFDKDGNIILGVLGKNTLKLAPAGLLLKLDDGATLNVQNKDADATLKLGDGAVHATIVEHLKTLYEDLKSYIENAIVNTGMGPSATILASNGPAPAWDTAIESTKVSFPDG
jgi:hypothetical protein